MIYKVARITFKGLMPRLLLISAEISLPLDIVEMEVEL